ncbi:MAG: hypothetical protein WCP56_03560 [Candidatus Saccharibacteria bacterium]
MGESKLSKKASQPRQTRADETTRKSDKPRKCVFELQGPCGKFFAQARTPDQARGVYLAAFPVLPRNLECITVTAVTHEPIAPYHVITHKRNRPVVTRRFP